MMVYILFDTALNGLYTLMMLQKAYPENHSLFKGTKDEALSDVAPYIFRVDELLFKKINDPYVSMENMVAFESDVKIQILLPHFQHFIYQRSNGKENYFRFWDARVLSRFLPSCTGEKLTDFFEGITGFYGLDIKNGRAQKWLVRRGKLQTTDSAISELFVLANDGQLELQHDNSAMTENDQQKKTKRKFFN